MPSSARQRIITLNRKDRNTKGSIILIRRTGYINLIINGQPFRPNYVKTYSISEKINLDKIIKEQNEKQARNKKQVILITKKGG